MKSRTDLAKAFVEADLIRRQACAEVLETDNCHYCPLAALNKCVWQESIGEINITENEYVAWLEFVDEASEFGKDYYPLTERMSKWLDGIIPDPYDNKRW